MQLHVKQQGVVIHQDLNSNRRLLFSEDREKNHMMHHYLITYD